MGGFKPIHKNGGIYKKNTTVCEIRQEGFGKFIEVKREKYDTSCTFMVILSKEPLEENALRNVIDATGYKVGRDSLRAL